jgi:hypothetical protein
METTKYSKGGDYRVELINAVDGDYFILPKGCIIESITIKEKDTVGGNIAIGVDALYETSTLKITHIATSVGNVRVSHGGVNYDVAVRPKGIVIPVTQGADSNGGTISVTLEAGTPVTTIVTGADVTPASIVTKLALSAYGSDYTAVADGDNLIIYKKTGDWGTGDVVLDAGTSGVLFGTLDTVGTGTIATLASYLKTQLAVAMTGLVTVDVLDDTLTFTAQFFANTTNLSFTDIGVTGVTATATTVQNGRTGNEVVTLASLSGVLNRLTALTLISTGQVQSLTAATNVYINITTAAQVDVFVNIQELTI